MFKSKRLCIAIAIMIVVLLAPVNAGASPSRVAAMALDATTYWMIGIDEVLFGVNPAILAELRPQVWGELSTGPTVAGGLILSPSKGLNLYLLLGQPLQFFGGAYPFPSAAPAPALDVNQEMVRLGASFQASQSLELGVSLMYTGMSNTADAASEKDSNNVVDLGAGAIIIINPGTMNIDVAADVTMWMLHRETTAGVSYDTLAFDFGGVGRLNWKMVANNTLHIYAAAALRDRSAAVGVGGPRNQNSWLDIDAGLSDEFNITDSIMVFAGGLFAVHNHATASNTTTLSISATAGLDAGITKEIAARVGIQHTFWQNTSNSQPVTSTSTAPDTSFACGFGVMLGDFNIDFHLQEAILLNGPYFVSGAATGGGLSADLTVTYHFGPSSGMLK